MMVPQRGKMEPYGYAGKILRVDLSSANTAELSTADYADRFLGGRGVAAKLYWDEVPAERAALDADNALILATGPMAGIPELGGSRWVVCGKSPAISPEHFSSANLGGRWGLDLKFAGYDALVVQGKLEKPGYLFLHDGVVEFRDASALWGKGAIETREILKVDMGSSVSVVSIGPAGENRARMAILVADDDATGSSGLGAVMGSKNLKAIVVKRVRKKMKVAQPERLKELSSYFHLVGTELRSVAGNLTFRITGPRTKKAPCYGCRGNCLRRTYESEDGQKGKFMCQAATLYQPMAEMYYGPGHEVPFRATRLCNDYGLDTMALSMIILWLYRCHRAGLLTDEDTGIPISRIGSLEFIETLVRKVSLREGFGDILAQGVLKAADWVGPGARDQIAGFMSKGELPALVDPRLYINTELLHATEPSPPHPQLREITYVVCQWAAWRRDAGRSCVSTDVVRRIARQFWGSEAAADFSTHEGKALAAKMIQDRQYAKESLILCSFWWPIMHSEHTEGHVGDPSLESKMLSAATGTDVAEEELCRIGERVLNLHRAILVGEGHRGREDDRLPDDWHAVPVRGDPTNPECLVPGGGEEVLCRRGSVVDRGEFERTKDEYYALRGWDVATGLQTRVKLQQLGLEDVAQDLERRGLTK